MGAARAGQEKRGKMSFTAISNIEGTDNWKRFISEKDLKNDSHIVFLGDYFAQNDDNSPINEQQYVKSIDNFLEICALAKESPFVHLLLGNRDFQYTPFDSVKTGGYNQKYQKEFEKALMDNINLFDIVYFYELKTKSETTKFIFSHAGITSCYLDLMDINLDAQMPEKLNNLFKTEPEKFIKIKP